MGLGNADQRSMGVFLLFFDRTESALQPNRGLHDGDSGLFETISGAQYRADDAPHKKERSLPSRRKRRAKAGKYSLTNTADAVGRPDEWGDNNAIPDISGILCTLRREY